MWWSNIFSYGEDNFIDFTKSTISQVIGPNGVGKTSILHILEEILCNKNSKGYKKASIVNRTKNWYSGGVTLDIDGVPYTVSMKRSGNTQKVILLRDKEDISQHTASATYDLIEKLLKIDFKTLSQIVSQNSKSSLQFLTTTDTLRKKFLIDLLNYEIYLEIYEVVKDIHKKAADELKVIEAEHKHLVEWINDKGKVKLQRMELVEVPGHPTELETEIESLTKEIHTIDATLTAIRKNNQYIELRNSIPSENLVESSTVVNLSDLKSEAAVLTSDITSAKTKLAKIKKLAGKCHECLQNIPASFTTEKADECHYEIALKTELLNSINSKILEGTAGNNRALLIKKYVADFEKYSGLIDSSLPTQEPNKEDLEQKLRLVSQKCKVVHSSIKNALDHNQAATVNNTKLDLIETQRVEIQSKLDKVKIALANKMEQVNELEILKKAFSTNGLVAYKIENSVKELEDLTNQYLEELSDGRFQLFFIINNDKLNVVIKDSGVSVDIEALSAGELSRVTTATLLAIRRLMSTLSKSQINLLFLDETLDVLDSDGKEKLIEILLKENNLNTFLISHAYTHPLLSKVLISKVNGTSKLDQV